VKPKEMTEEDIMEMVKAFGAAAERAVQARADGLQIHAAHGYLISEFLSPFFNVRKDSWGGSDENRFRFLKVVFQEIKNKVQCVSCQKRGGHTHHIILRFDCSAPWDHGSHLLA
jgi:2,4-dienoyl-CoA reductase-like NADH-dependent reductase (Old Yellow Enzyme family)